MTRGQTGVATAGLVTVAVAGWAVHSGLEVRELRAETTGRTAAVRAAESGVVGLISVSSATTEADIQQLADGATSSFRSQLKAESKALRNALHGQEVTSTGSVTSSGVVDYSPNRARVIVAAKGSVANKAVAGPQPRSYRLRVDLRKVDGHWLVSGLEFVA
jgi:Mce-associated membrane protein